MNRTPYTLHHTPFKVGIIGPESTGKSTLARYLARRYKGTYVPEYAREYVERKGSTHVTWDELCEIAHHQIEQIKSLTGEAGLTVKRSHNEVVFFDTELIVSKIWFSYAFGRIPEWLNDAIRTYPMDFYLLTKPDIPWIPDPARENGSDTIRQELFDRYEAEIQALNIPYFVVEHDENP